MLGAYRRGLDDELEGYSMSSLHNKKVKHLLTEVYVALKRQQRAELKAQVGRAIIPIASMSFDFCKAKVSGDQYGGKHIPLTWSAQAAFLDWGGLMPVL
jgi:hypothetical protein